MNGNTGSPIEDARDYIARIIADGPRGAESYVDWVWSRRDAFHEQHVREMRRRFGIGPSKSELHVPIVTEAANSDEPAAIDNITPLNRVATK